MTRGLLQNGFISLIPVGESGLKDRTAAAKRSALEDVGMTNVGVDIFFVTFVT